jgi:hypothetical protein
MCVRTKTSYGCGCQFKDTDECCSSRCSGMERYHYLKEGDCRSCRTGGNAVTRGREGKGRYAQEMSRRSPVDVSGGASPWAPSPNPSRREKEWQSPTRQRADSAWEEEHSSRIDDLQSRIESITLEPDSSRHTIARSPEPLDDKYYSQESDHHDRHSRRGTTRSRTSYDHQHDNDSRAHRRREIRPIAVGPIDSYESLSSVTAKPYKPTSSRTRSHKHDDPYDSGYGGSQDTYRSYSYNSSRHNTAPPTSSRAPLHGYGAKTEPHAYSYSSPSSRTLYEVPMASTYGAYSSPLGAYGVELLPTGHARLTSSRRY